jgi:hypothetical protein
MRITDLRSGSVMDRHGATRLLNDAPRAPTREVSSTGDDVSLTATTGRQGWPGSAAGLDNHALTTASGDGIEGVTQAGNDFFITDRAHPDHGLPLGPSVSTLEAAIGSWSSRPPRRPVPTPQ